MMIPMRIKLTTSVPIPVFYSYSGYTELLLSPAISTACIQPVLFHKDSPNIESINTDMHFLKDNSNLASWNGRSLKRIDPHQNSLDKDRINGHYRHMCRRYILGRKQEFCKLTELRVIGISSYPLDQKNLNFQAVF